MARMTKLHEIVNEYRRNFEKQRLMVVRTMKGVKDYIYWFYVQYLLVSCIVDMEPWEKVLAHIFTTITLIMSLFAVYSFIPTHLNQAFQFFLQLVK